MRDFLAYIDNRGVTIMNLKQLQKQLNIQFKNERTYQQAFTHSSYVNEHQSEKIGDNERLEFLGDAVLELAISDYLFNAYPDMPEGELTKLRAAIVRESSLARFAKTLNLDQYVLLGKGEEQGRGRERPALLADVFEAFLGALYLDQGYQSVVYFLETHIYKSLTTHVFSHQMDYKSKLQEYVQQDKKLSVYYEIIHESGPSHDKEFKAKVYVPGFEPQIGIGKTKKEAEQRGAQKVLDMFMAKKTDSR